MYDIWIRVATRCCSQRRKSKKGWWLNETVLKKQLNWSNIVSKIRMKAVEKAGLISGIRISLLVLNSYTTFESFCQQGNSVHLDPYITLLLLLAFVSLGRRWNSAPWFSWWLSCSICCGCTDQVPVVQRLDNAIHRMNCHPGDTC